jgi:hypothetical protein
MEVSAHLQKWRRFDAVRGRFDPVAEFELWYWATAAGATTLLNAALHVTGVTDETRLFPTQVAFVYAGVDESTRWHREVRASGDLIVLGLPEIAQDVPDALTDAIDAMQRIESFREPYARGIRRVGLDTVSTVDDAYGVVVERTLEAIGAWQT